MMATDIAPELLEKLQESFSVKFSNNKKISKIYSTIKNGKPTYAEANDLSIEVGDILAEVFKENISSDILPDGKMHYNIAKRTVEPMLKNNYDIVTNGTVGVQEHLNKQAGIGIKAQTPELNQDRIDGIINRLDEEELYEDVKWILGEPVKNFTQAVVDDAIKVNADLHAKSGMRPKIIRKTTGNCCDWCAEIVGIYEYPNVPEDVYRRHRFCNCSVEYEPSSGKRQNVWDKSWYEVDKSTQIEERKQLSLRTEKKDKGSSDVIAGVKRGKQMSFSDANEGKGNVFYSHGGGYTVNCQTSVVAHEARLRGYDVTAKANTKGSVSEILSRDTNKAWLGADGLPLKGSTDVVLNGEGGSATFTAKSFRKYLDETIQTGERYTMGHEWKSKRTGGSGHIVSAFKDEGGNLKIYDPQTGEKYFSDSEIDQYLKRIKYSSTTRLGRRSIKYNHNPNVLRVDNLEFNMEIAGKILQEIQ